MSNIIYFVVGPTGAGKSSWGLAQAEANNGVIVNADSIQIFRGLDIGSAKPSPEEQKRVPHHLYDIVDPTQDFTAGDYFRAARPLVEELQKQHNIYVVGGSGFYLQALEKGIYEVGPISEEIESEILKIKMQGQLFEMTEAKDPQAAKRIGPHDEYRLQRALAVMLSTGQTLTEIETSFGQSRAGLAGHFQIRKVGLACGRDLLRQRIQARTRKMLSSGLLDEVQKLIAAGLKDSKALRSIGYRECVKFLSGGLSLTELEQEIIQSTMQLAKKQMTWFKRDKEIHWIQSPRA